MENKFNAFYRLDNNNNAMILDIDSGEPIIRLDAGVYPVESNESARYDHPAGIILTVEDAESIGIMPE